MNPNPPPLGSWGLEYADQTYNWLNRIVNDSGNILSQISDLCSYSHAHYSLQPLKI